MYVPLHFQEDKLESLHGLITEYPLGTLVVQGAGGLNANHIPFAFHPGGGEQGMLLAHVARANPVWQSIASSDEVLVIFQGSNAYVSPNWYPSKRVSHRQVPTWNYRAVHAYGKAKVRHDEKFLRGIVARLTRSHEALAGSAEPWKITDAPPDYIDEMLAVIVGLEITITKIIGKSKLSQNKSEDDRMGVAKALVRQGDHEMGAAMQPSSPKV